MFLAVYTVFTTATGLAPHHNYNTSCRKLCMVYSSRAWSLCDAASCVIFLSYSIVLDCDMGALVTRTLKTVKCTENKVGVGGMEIH